MIFHFLIWSKQFVRKRKLAASCAAVLAFFAVGALAVWTLGHDKSAHSKEFGDKELAPDVLPRDQQSSSEPSFASQAVRDSQLGNADSPAALPLVQTTLASTQAIGPDIPALPIALSNELESWQAESLHSVLQGREIQPHSTALLTEITMDAVAQARPAFVEFPMNKSVPLGAGAHARRTAQVANTPTATPAPQPVSTPKPTPQITEVTSHYFTIHTTRFLRKPGKDGVGVWEQISDQTGRQSTGSFRESLVVEVSTKHHTASKSLFARAYFYDASGNLVEAQKSPAQAGKESSRAHFAMPVLFQENQREYLYFPIPPKLKGQRWQGVVVFGDKDEAKATTYPGGASLAMLDFPEKKLVMDRTMKLVQRKKVANRVVEYVSKTRNPKHPQITLFLRPPKGIDDWSEVKGVYALVVLANSADEIRRSMQTEELDGDAAGTFAFANRHKLAVLMWGSQRTWNPGMNYDDYERRQAEELDSNFDDLADAWERGIQHFHQEYGIPTRNYFLQGNCGAAQWAKRLCLRKPDYFIATHIHMPGSYDRPTPEAAKVLWCLTIGELDGGYERSIRWAQAARDMGYPLIYKPIPSLGHGGHPTANKLAHETFEFAMQRIADREAYDEQLKRRMGNAVPVHWLKEFVDPPYFADFINQEVFPKDDIDMIPPPFRMPIPSKRIADVWMLSR